MCVCMCVKHCVPTFKHNSIVSARSVGRGCRSSQIERGPGFRFPAVNKNCVFQLNSVPVRRIPLRIKRCCLHICAENEMVFCCSKYVIVSEKLRPFLSLCIMSVMKLWCYCTEEANFAVILKLSYKLKRRMEKGLSLIHIWLYI